MFGTVERNLLNQEGVSKKRMDENGRLAFASTFYI